MNSRPTRNGFRAGAKAIRYCVKIALERCVARANLVRCLFGNQYSHFLTQHNSPTFIASHLDPTGPFTFYPNRFKLCLLLACFFRMDGRNEYTRMAEYSTSTTVNIIQIFVEQMNFLSVFRCVSGGSRRGSLPLGEGRRVSVPLRFEITSPITSELYFTQSFYHY